MRSISELVGVSIQPPGKGSGGKGKKREKRENTEKTEKDTKDISLHVLDEKAEKKVLEKG